MEQVGDAWSAEHAQLPPASVGPEHGVHRGGAMLLLYDELQILKLTLPCFLQHNGIITVRARPCRAWRIHH